MEFLANWAYIGVMCLINWLLSCKEVLRARLQVECRKKAVCHLAVEKLKMLITTALHHTSILYNGHKGPDPVVLFGYYFGPDLTVR